MRRRLHYDIDNWLMFLRYCFGFTLEVTIVCGVVVLVSVVVPVLVVLFFALALCWYGL